MPLARKSMKVSKPTGLLGARAYILSNARYVSPTLFALVPYPVEGLIDKIGGPLAVSDKLVLLYEPEWVEAIDYEMLGACIFHEILHIQLNHFRRGLKYPDKKKWNKAGDLFINQSMRSMVKQVPNTTPSGSKVMVEEQIWKLPDWVLYPEKYELPLGKTADQYYYLIQEWEQKNQKELGEEEGEGDGEDEGGDGNEDSGGKGKGGATGKNGKGKIGAGNCGGAAGNPSKLEQQINQEVGRTDSHVSWVRKKTTENIQKVMEAKGQGTAPGVFSEIVEWQNKRPTIPWTAKLAMVMRGAFGRARTGGLDYSMSRPSKRGLLLGIPRPGLIKRDLVIFIVLDTSGSVRNHQFIAALAEAKGIVLQSGVDYIWMMQVDAAKQTEPVRVAARDLDRVEIHGRGGTDFRPAFEEAMKMRPAPDVLVYMTDGMGTYPEYPPRAMQTVWCLMPGPKRQPPWGDVVEMQDDEL